MASPRPQSEDPRRPLNTVPRSNPVDEQLLRSLSSAPEDSERDWQGLADGFKFAASTEFQIMVNQSLQGGGETSLRQMLRALYKTSNPGMSDAELDDWTINSRLRLQPMTESAEECDEDSLGVATSFAVPFPTTVGEIVGMSNETQSHDDNVDHASHPNSDASISPPRDQATRTEERNEPCSSVGSREDLKQGSNDENKALCPDDEHAAGIVPGPLMRSFVYEPLSTTKPEIRLLRLASLPSPDRERLQLSLTNFPLDEQIPPFRAISYCWGDAKERAEIVCNQQTLTITASLDYAIKRILNWKSDLYLWADGICINQEDLAERASQVKLMGEIYSKAESTVAYLGEALGLDEEDKSTALDTAQSGLALMMQLNAIWGEGEEEEEEEEKNSEVGYSDDRHPLRSAEEWTQIQIPDAQSRDGLYIWIPLIHLCSQPWFSRSWIFQEVVLAKEVLVFYGGAVNGLGTLTRFWELATRRDPPPALMHGFVADWKDGTESWNQLNAFGEMRKARGAAAAAVASAGNAGVDQGNGLVHQPNGDSGFIILGAGERQQQISHSLLNLLVRNRSADATDSRDKVYSLLALAADVGKGVIIEPDYSPGNTAARLYQDVASAYIRIGRGVEILHHAGLPQRLSSDLPTWVPDWSVKSRQPLCSEAYRCTRDTVPPHLQLLPCPPGGHDGSNNGNSRLLRVRGALIDATHLLMHKVGLQRLGPLTGSLEEWLDRLGNMWSIESDSMAPKLPFGPGRDQTFGAIVSHAEMFALQLLSSSSSSGLSSSSPYPASVRGIRNAVWQTLAAGRGWAASPNDPNGEGSAHEAWCQWRPDPFDNAWWPPRELTPSEREAIWPFQAIVLRQAQGYRFGFTACGYMGLFPSVCETGDLIAMLPGASTPFVVRPIPGDSSSSSSSSFKLVGPCYIHGIMRGELLKPSWHGSGEFQDAQNPEIRYRVRQRGWSRNATDLIRRPLKPYFDPERSREVPIHDIDLH